MARYSDNRKRILTVERIIAEYKDGISIDEIIAVLEIEHGIKASIPSIHIDIDTLRDFLPIEVLKKAERTEPLLQAKRLGGGNIRRGNQREKMCALRREIHTEKQHKILPEMPRIYARAAAEKKEAKADAEAEIQY